MSPILASHQSELADLCKRFRVRRLDVFGSTARGEDREGSDVDFLVEFEPMDEEYFGSYFGLLFGLQELFGKSVDLVVDKSIRNPYFRQSVERDRTPVYAA